MQIMKSTALIVVILLLLTGCSMSEESTEWIAGKANDTLEVIGGGVQEVLDDLHNAEYQGGPFENNLDSARAYLLEQMQEKYGIEFKVVGDEDLVNYGLFAGATYTCEVAPTDAPALALCEAKDYVIDQRISLEMPETEKTWTATDGLEHFFSESGAYVKLVLRFTDDLDTETYAAYLYDFLNSVDQLECNLLLQAKANKVYIYHEELDILDGFDASCYTVENLKQEIEENLSMGVPNLGI